jgi:MFS family permease
MRRRAQAGAILLPARCRASRDRVPMPPSQPRHSLALRVNQRFFYGWVMLGVAALGMLASGPGQSHIFSVFILPIGQDLGISHTSVSSAYALATLVAAFGLPWVGRMVDRHGVRPVLLSVAVLLGFAAMAFGAVTGMATLALGFAALRFLGQGSLMLCSANLVAQWFDRKRGFALSLMGLGFSLTMAAHPPLAQWLIDELGWRAAWFWLGIMTWLLLVPAVAILVENKPESLGLVPDGPAAGDEASRISHGHAADVGLSIGQAVRAPAFWIIALSLATFSMLVTGLFFHQVSIFQSAGLSPQMAAWVFPISALTMVMAMPVFGRLLDRMPTKPMFACAMLTMTAAMLALVLAHDAATAALYGIVFGINNAAVHTHMSYVWPRFFGRRYLGSIQGTAQTIAVIGASLGPLPLGAAFDLYGAYTGALLTLAVLPVLCSIAILLMRPPQLEGA